MGLKDWGLYFSVDLDETHPQEARELLETILGPPTIVVAIGMFTEGTYNLIAMCTW